MPHSGLQPEVVVCVGRPATAGAIQTGDLMDKLLTEIWVEKQMKKEQATRKRVAQGQQGLSHRGGLVRLIA